MNDLESVLTNFSEKIGEITKVVNETYKNGGEDYNLLDVLTKHHLEEFHTNYICDMLNPAGKHKERSVFLEAFIDVLKEKKNDESVGFVKLMKQLERIKGKYENAEVNKEKRIKEIADRGIYGRMDIFIQFPETLNLVVENKIHSGEGVNQIKRYADYCETIQPPSYSILYLTLEGDSADSTIHDRYVAISYREQIYKWLVTCLAKSKKCSVKAGIEFYMNMLENKFLKSKHNNMVEGIKDLILKEENRVLIERQSEIADAFEAVKKHYRNKFFNVVFREFEEKGYQPEAVNPELIKMNAEQLWNKKDSGILFRNDTYTFQFPNSNKTMHVLIEHDGGDLDYGFVVVEKDKDGREGYANDFPDKDDIKKGIEEQLKNKWTYSGLISNNKMYSMKRFQSSSSNVPKSSFGDARLNFEFADNMNSIVNQFVDDVEKYLGVFKDYIDNLKRAESK